MTTRREIMTRGAGLALGALAAGATGRVALAAARLAALRNGLNPA